MFRLNVPHSCKNYASTFSFCFGRVNLKCFYSTQSQQAEEEHFSPQFQPIIGLEVFLNLFLLIRYLWVIPISVLRIYFCGLNHNGFKWSENFGLIMVRHAYFPFLYSVEEVLSDPYESFLYMTSLSIWPF